MLINVFNVFKLRSFAHMATSRWSQRVACTIIRLLKSRMVLLGLQARRGKDVVKLVAWHPHAAASFPLSRLDEAMQDPSCPLSVTSPKCRAAKSHFSVFL